MSSSAFKITLIYIIVGSIWILLSDSLLLQLVDINTLSKWQSLKGLLYIFVTALLLFYLIKHSEKTIIKKSDELLANEIKFREAVDHINDIFIIFDSEKRIQYLNRTAVALSGKSKQEIIGRKTEEIFPVDLISVFLPLITKTLETKESLKKEKEIFFNNKKYYSIIENLPVLNEQKQIQYIISIWHDVTRRKQFEEKLLKSKSELQELNRHLNIARENERASISRDIHDHLGQMLTGIKMDLTILKKKINSKLDPFEKINQLESETEETIKIVRRISEELRPPAIDDLGLLVSLESYIESFEKRSNIKCNLYSNNSEIKLSSQQSITIFRVIQEALTNVARHSNATNVKIEIHFEESKLILEIEDNGIGFDVNEKRGNTFGLLGMRERLNLIGGSYKINSEKNVGTKIIAEIPL